MAAGSPIQNSLLFRVRSLGTLSAFIFRVPDYYPTSHLPHSMTSDSHFNYCSLFFFKSSLLPTSFILWFHFSLSLSASFSPFFLLLRRVETDSCGPCGFAPWATCTVMWKSFSRWWSFIHRYCQQSLWKVVRAKPLRKKKIEMFGSCERFNSVLHTPPSFLSFWKHSVSLSYFLPLSRCNFIIFHINASSASCEH